MSVGRLIALKNSARPQNLWVKTTRRQEEIGLKTVLAMMGDQSPKPPGILRIDAGGKLALGEAVVGQLGKRGRPSRPPTCLQPLGRRSGCFPAEPYPPPRPKAIVADEATWDTGSKRGVIFRKSFSETSGQGLSRGIHPRSVSW